MPPSTSRGSRERTLAPRGAMRPPSAPPTGTKRKERDFEQDTGDETNINVVVRCRGRSEREVRENSGVVVDTSGVKSNNVTLCMGPNSISNKVYHFDRVFSPAADQAMVFEDVVLPILGEMLSGYNCTIFAYGQTGTGKTYTMSGDMNDRLGILSDNAGIIPRVLYSLFQKLENDGSECSVKCSFIELYNEELRDLLSPDETVKLKIFDDSSRKSHGATLVQGMEESHIKTAGDGIKLLQQGSHRRQVAATKCNDLSSRSHTVFTITTYVKKSADSEDYICSGKLNLVDLAGSENIQRSGAENRRAAEAGLINKSLLTLGRVINALVDKSQHIPYRESKLTRLLQDSLGGRTKTCIIATISQSKSNLEETISTLDYAFRAKNIRNKPQVNTMISKKTLLREFTTEIEKLKSELIAHRQRNGVYLTNDQYEEITVESESRKILSEEQKARIETMEANLRNKVQELFNLKTNFTILKKDSDATKAALESTRDILVKTDLVLKETERDLIEEAALRQAHQATEIKLRGIGTQLISTVGESLHDIDALNAKLRRRSELHRQNQQAWTSTATHAKDISEEMNERIDNLKQGFDGQISTIAERIEQFVSDELQRVLKGREAVNFGSTDFTSRLDIISNLSSDARHDMNDVLEEIKVLREDVKARVGAGLHGLSEAAARISGEVISELDEFHAQLHASYSDIGKDFKQMFDRIMAELTSQREEADRLRLALQETNRKAVKSSESAASQLQACLVAEQQAAEEDRQQLMQQISALITDSQSKRNTRVTRAINLVETSIAQSKTDIEKADHEYGEGMDSWAAQDSGLFDMVSTSRDALKNRMQEDWTAVEARNLAIQNSTKAVHGETVRIVKEQLESMSTQMAALDEFVTRARRQNDENHEAHVHNLNGLTVHVNRTFEDVASVFESESANIMKSDFESYIGKLQKSMTPLESDIRQPLQDLTTHFASNNLADYVPTGETPLKKMWDYPTTLPQTVTSTTPPSDPPLRQMSSQTPSRTRSPRKSPKKMTSPRKIVKEVYVDSPVSRPRFAVSTRHHPVELKRIASARSASSQASLKEIDANASNHTITLPIKHDTYLVQHQTETVPLKEGGKEYRSDRLPGSNRTTPHRGLRTVRSAKNLSASVGVGTLVNGEDNNGGKENFQPSKSVQISGVTVGGRRLRSGNVTRSV